MPRTFTLLLCSAFLCSLLAGCEKDQIDIEEVAYALADINGAINNSSKRLAMISDRSKELYFNHLT
ncbi:MAG: hypothetical protein II515_02210, partial [Desulfovibrio sp.]|nr:hypothetical protein [Desulfovibrio sp.]